MHIENRAIGAGTAKCGLRVKGKQVEVLRDLVTVSREHWIMRMPEGMAATGFGDREGNLMCVELRARKPAICWYRSIPDHEDLVVPYDL